MRPQRGVLIDTHIFLWALIDSPRLSRRVRGILQSDRPIYVSAVSMAEITIKSESGALAAFPEPISGFESLGYRELPFDARSAESLARFPALFGHDPFDRMLIAQAATHSLSFETADRRLNALGLPFIHDATASAPR